MTLRFPPSEQYLYSNIGWYLLGEVIERVGGQSLGEHLQNQVFAPLEMTHSGHLEDLEGQLVTGYRWAKPSAWQSHVPLNWHIFRGGAGLYANARDLSRFLRGVHRGELLSTRGKERLFSELTPYGWRTSKVDLGDSESRTLRSYDGQLEGHSSLVYYLLEDDISLVLLGNIGTGIVHKTVLADALLEAWFAASPAKPARYPSMDLQQSLVEGQWLQTLNRLQRTPLDDLQAALLVRDLAQQLSWSGLSDRAIDLYVWLVNSYPSNAALQSELQTLCTSHASLQKCRARSGAEVGMTLLPLVDKQRNAWRSNAPRPLNTHLFFPTRDTEKKVVGLGPQQAPLFLAGEVVLDAQPMSGKRPLVLMSHGTGGSALQMLWLAEALVEAGYIVAAVNHHGNTAFEPEKFPEGFLLWWERARDLQQVSHLLRQHPDWSPYIDAENIAVVGFSLGGYTALSALGAITDKPLFERYCDDNPQDFSCQVQPEFLDVLKAFEEVSGGAQVMDSLAHQHDVYRLPGVRAAVVIAPAVVHAFRPHSLQNIHTPTHFIVGSEDRIAPGAENAQYAYKILPNSSLTVIPGGYHYSFLSVCSDEGKRQLNDLCGAPNDIKRETVHEHTIAATLTFLEGKL